MDTVETAVRPIRALLPLRPMTGATLLSNLSNENAGATIETERQICIQRQSLQEVSVSVTRSTPPGHFSLRLRLECCFLCAHTLSGPQLEAFSDFTSTPRALKLFSPTFPPRYINIYFFKNYFHSRQTQLRKDVGKHRTRVSSTGTELKQNLQKADFFPSV